MVQVLRRGKRSGSQKRRRSVLNSAGTKSFLSPKFHELQVCGFFLRKTFMKRIFKKADSHQEIFLYHLHLKEKLLKPVCLLLKCP